MIYKYLPERLKRAAEKRWFTGSRRQSFYSKIAELHENGIRIDAILESLENRAIKNRRPKVEAGFYAGVRRGFSQSGSFSQALKEYVPVIERILIRAGEQSGHLSDTLRTAGDLSVKNGKMKSLMLKALAYPIVVLILALCVLCWFSGSLFPALEDFVPLADWPWISRLLYSAGIFLNEWAILFIICVIGLFALFIWLLPRMTGRVRIWLDRVPPWSFYRLYQGAAWIASLSSMVSSGSTSNEALSIIAVEAKENPWLLERTNAVKDRLASVRSIGEALNTGYGFPDAELCSDMADYDGSANFNEVFAKIGREWTSAGMEKIETDAKILNGVSMALAMLVIIGLLQAIMGLMMDISMVISGT